MKRQCQYAVPPEDEAQQEDDSFKLCFSTMLVFLVLVTLTCLLFWPTQSKDNHSDTVLDSLSSHLGHKIRTTMFPTDKPKTSTETETKIPTASPVDRINPTVNQTTTDISSVKASASTEISDLDLNLSKVTLISTSTSSSEPEEEFIDKITNNTQTTVILRNETVTFPTETKNTDEKLEFSISFESNVETTNEVSVESFTITEIPILSPDYSENSIPYFFTTEVENGISSIFEHVNLIPSEVSTDTTLVVSEISASNLGRVEKVTQDDLAFTTVPDHKTSSDGDLKSVSELLFTSGGESTNLFGVDFLAENSTAPESSPSMVDYTIEDYDLEPNLMIENTTTEELEINSTDVVAETASDNMTMEANCPTCPTPVCPACLVKACSDNQNSIPFETRTPSVDKICSTSQCHVFASRLLSLVDVSVDPCDDFYSYACGGILNSQLLLEDDLSVDVWNRIQRAVKNISPSSPLSHRQYKNYYYGCVSYDLLVTLEERKAQGRKVLQGFGNFVDFSTTPEDDLTELLIKLLRYGRASLFSLLLDVDSKDSSRFQAVISVPDRMPSHFLTAGERSSRCRHEAGDDLDEAYEVHKNCMKNFSEMLLVTQKALEFFQVFDHLPVFNSSQLILDVLDSLDSDFLEILKDLPPPDRVQKDLQLKNYTLISKVRLQAEIPQVDWGYLLSSLFSAEFDDNTKVQIYFLDYIKELFNSFQKKGTRAVHNSLLAVFAHDLYWDLVETRNTCDRERYCLHVTARLLPHITSNLYLDSFPSHVDRDLRQKVTTTYQKLVSAMERRLTEAEWFDDSTRNEVMKKLKLMSIQLPGKYTDSQLTGSISTCELNTKQYLQDSVCLQRQFQSQYFARYTKNPYTADVMWPHFSISFSTKPVFIYGLNTFLVSHSVLNTEMPEHVVMARLGNTLARGIAHSFDPTGVKFLADGRLGMLFSEASLERYKFVLESNNLLFSWRKSHWEGNHNYSYLLDPELSQNERFSDIFAANLSLSVLLQSEVEDRRLPWLSFSSKQVYFLALAQTFCSKKKIPEIFETVYEETGLLPFDRVFNLAANSEQFAEAFHCSKGTNMNMESELKARPFPIF